MIYLGIGSNLDDRMQNISDAISVITQNRGIELINVSSVYKTMPYGMTEQPEFFNIVLKIDTTMTAHQLLDFVKNIENEMGRTDIGHWGPRIIDIDILFFRKQRINDDVLTIPHCDLENRAFVLYPLLEIEPDFIHPLKKIALNKIIKDNKISADSIEVLGELK